MLLLCEHVLGTISRHAEGEIPPMSSRPLDTVREDALALSEIERAELARDLVASLDGPSDPEVAAAWDVEICRRINEIESGSATLFDSAEVLARARNRLKGV